MTIVLENEPTEKSTANIQPDDSLHNVLVHFGISNALGRMNWANSLLQKLLYTMTQPRLWFTTISLYPRWNLVPVGRPTYLILNT